MTNLENGKLQRFCVYLSFYLCKRLIKNLNKNVTVN